MNHTLMNIREASEYLFGSPKRVATIRTLIRNGKLAHYKIGNTHFFKAADLDESVERCRVEPNRPDFSKEKNVTVGSFGTSEGKSRQAAALEKLKQHRKR